MNRRSMIGVVMAMLPIVALVRRTKAETPRKRRPDRMVYNGRGEVIGMMSLDGSRVMARRTVPKR